MKFDKSSLIAFGKRLKDRVAEHDVSGGAAELAYRFFLAIFPFLIFLAALGGFLASAFNVDNPTDEVMSLIGDSLPEDSSSVLRTQLEGVIEQRNAGLMSLGVLAAIWAASSGINGLMKNMNRIYDVGESRSMVVRYAISLGLTFLSAGLMVGAFIVFFIGQIYGTDIAAEVGLGETLSNVLTLARWPAAIIMVVLAMAFMYWLAPNTPMKLQWISPGAVFFGLSWVIASFLFGVYVSNFGSYNATYGTLGGIVILLIWFYLTAFLILLGAEINATLTEGAIEEDPPAEPADAADADRTTKLKAGILLAGLIWLAAAMRSARLGKSHG
jgi:membrane protein